jgi:methyl-accepting chemotaxis protein
MRKFTGLLFVIALLVPAVAFAQFGGLGGGQKLNTKEADKVLKQIDSTVAEYDQATAQLWESTEIVQNLIAQYSEGQFPALTQNWATIQKMIKDAKDDTERAAAFKLTDAYFVEMDQRKAKMEEILNDPVKSANVKQRFQAPEVEQLTKARDNVKTVPEKDQALIQNLPGLIEQTTAAIKDMTEQAAKNPLKANDAQKLIDKMNKGIEKLNKIKTDLDKQVNAANTLLGAIDKLLTK